MLLVQLAFLALIQFSSAEPSSSPASSSSGSSNSSVSFSAVCSPNQCVQGVNSLTAGLHTISNSNGSAIALVLLPGAYSSASAVSNTSTSILNLVGSTLSPSTGFNVTGMASSVVTVATNPGLVSYTSALYQGIPNYSPISTNFTNSTTNSPSSINSFLLSPATFAVIQIGASSTGRTIVWKSVANVGNFPGIGDKTVSILGMQSTACSVPCASGGICGNDGTCACAVGFTGSTCNQCLPGFFGARCSPCASGCGICDDGIVGTGRCLQKTALNSTAAACNCVNGICSGAGSTATCTCNTGWARSSTGSQCSVCAIGFFQSATGDCLACDPSCLNCAGPNGACLTCQPTLGITTDSTRCAIVASLSSSSNSTSTSTFTTCPIGTYLETSTSSCIPCSPLCASCFAPGTAGCLSCKAPYGLLGGQCVSVDQKSGICNGGANGGAWVLDNAKGVCDAAPAKCTFASIPNFSTISTRSQLTCSACLAGTFLSAGKCLTTCPSGTVALGSNCVACDSSCGSCYGTTTYCTSCSSSSQLALNGACIAGPSCPTGFFSSFVAPSTNSTIFSPSNSTIVGNSCLPCHPDCQTCGTKFDICLTCPPSRPIKSITSTCVQTCTSSQYFDTAAGTCTSCSAGCDTCSGNGNDQCLSCGIGQKLLSGSCVAAGCSKVVDGFGVCLEDLVTVVPTGPSILPSKTLLPWYYILLIILIGLLLLFTIIFLCRRKRQQRRAAHTAKFANSMDKKKVDLKLAQLPISIAYPIVPTSYESQPYHQETSEFYTVPVSPIAQKFQNNELNAPERNSRWSNSTGMTGHHLAAKRLESQITGESNYTIHTTGGTARQWSSKNPFSTGLGL